MGDAEQRERDRDAQQRADQRRGLAVLAVVLYHGGVAGVAVMVAASILVGVVFGALSNAVGMTLRSREAIIGVYTFFMLPLMFLSSAFIQTSLMPGWMQAIASRNPLNWVVQIGRSVAATPARRLAFLNGHGGMSALLQVACREIRTIWRKPDCLKPSLQKVQYDACRKDA